MLQMVILSGNISEKAVVDTAGTHLGMLYNVSMDLETGELQELVISSEDRQYAEINEKVDEDGRLRIPVDRVQAIKDHIIVYR